MRPESLIRVHVKVDKVGRYLLTSSRLGHKVKVDNVGAYLLTSSRLGIK